MQRFHDVLFIKNRENLSCEFLQKESRIISGGVDLTYATGGILSFPFGQIQWPCHPSFRYGHFVSTKLPLFTIPNVDTAFDIWAYAYQIVIRLNEDDFFSTCQASR
jgi:hypothetical protein